MTTTWHAPPAVLARYATQPGSLDAATASSLELHLLRCPTCRAGVAAATDPVVVEGSWREVADRIDRPRRTAAERFLRTIGVGETYARLVAATPSLEWAWLAAVTLIVVGLVAMTRATKDAGPFLLVAPLVPIGAIAAVFWPGSDPAAGAGPATPLAGFGLLARRVAAVLVPSAAVVAVGSLAVADLRPLDAAWILPALALCLATLGLGTWLRADVSAATIAAAWAVVVILAKARQHVPIRDLAVFSTRGQLLWMVVVITAGLTIVVRRDAFASPRRRSA